MAILTHNMDLISLLPILLPVFSTLSLFRLVDAHGFLSWPPTRGGLCHPLGIKPCRPDTISAPVDGFLVFPAGFKGTFEGAALGVQKSVAKNKWTPFKPLEKNFRWRAGVCGDTVSGFAHLRGGRFFWPRNTVRPHIAATLRPGGVLDARLRIVGHHNGFIEFHLCNVANCPGRDISPACFALGHCVQLKRVPNPRCDSGASRRCGPIDRNHPGRWYLPCSASNSDDAWDFYGGDGTILYRVPPWLWCEHCVLHWFWSAGNKCNADGVVEYFDGSDRPWGWGKCPGQAGAIGGLSRVQPRCGGKTFPEDYYACADVAVMRKPRRPRNPPVKPAEKRNPRLQKLKRGPIEKSNGSGIRKLSIMSLGSALGSVNSGDVLVGSTLPKLTFQVVAAPKVPWVKFVIKARDGRQWTWRQNIPPFVMFGSRREIRYWKNVVYDQWIVVQLSTLWGRRRYNLKFVRKA